MIESKETELDCLINGYPCKLKSYYNHCIDCPKYKGLMVAKRQKAGEPTYLAVHAMEDTLND